MEKEKENLKKDELKRNIEFNYTHTERQITQPSDQSVNIEREILTKTI